MPWPNFFIIGASKSGTTSLYHYLKQHPQIYMSPVKEPRFFAFHGETLEIGRYDQLSRKNLRLTLSDSITEPGDYLALFNGVKDENAIGEASPLYLQIPQAAVRIHQFIPHAKLLAVLRNPIDRTYSRFLMHSRSGLAPSKDILQTIALEDFQDASNPWKFPQYIRGSFYDIQLQYFLEAFPASQLRIFLYEDLQDPLKMLRDIFQFLEVDENFQPDISIRHNTASTVIQNPLMRAIINITPHSLRCKLKYALPPPVFRWYLSRRLGNCHQEKINKTQCPRDAREMLRPIFHDHILRLQDMIERDLSAWLQ